MEREAEGDHGLLSRNQCCPGGPRCSNGPCPVSALYLPHPPQGMAGRGQRIPSTGPAGWVAGASRRGAGREHECVSREGRASAPWQAQPTCGHTASLMEVKGAWEEEWSGVAISSSCLVPLTSSESSLREGQLGVLIHTMLNASSAKNRCSWEKGGRCSGSRLQH